MNHEHVMDNQGCCHVCGFDPTGMRRLLEQRVIENWTRGYDEMTNVAHFNGWKRQRQAESGRVTYIGKWTLHFGKDTPALRECVTSCNDMALLAWYEAQLCEIFR